MHWYVIILNDSKEVVGTSLMGFLNKDVADKRANEIRTKLHLADIFTLHVMVDNK